MSYVNYQVRESPFPIRYVMDLVRFRHLCWNLVGSDLRSRFRRSRLGILWAVIQPLVFSLMIAFVWGNIFKSQSYWAFAAYVFSGMIVWEYFSSATLISLDALVSANGYLRQQRIPFLVFQLRGPLVGAVIFLAGLIGLFVLLAGLHLAGIMRFPPLGLHLLLILPALGLLFLFIVPLTMMLSVAGTQFRDLRYITTLMLQAVFFVTPVMLERRMLEEPPLNILNYINPAVPMINLLRDPILHGTFWNMRDVVVLETWTAGLWVAAVASVVGFGRKVIFAI